MNRHKWQIVSHLRQWSAANPDEIIACELCDAHASYTTQLIDEQTVVQESRWHCDAHGDDAIKSLERIKYATLKIIIQPRHWMHVWKVGYVPCVICRNDSRVVVSFVNVFDSIVDQKMYCNHHCPESTPSEAPDFDESDLISHITFGLGFSINGFTPHDIE